MAISSENRKTGIFTGDGKTTRYPFDFRILKTEHIAVITDDAIGNEHILSEGRDYTATLETDGGHIDLAAPLGKGRRLVIVSNQPYLQPAVFTNHGGFYPANLNDALDKLVIQDQQILEQISRALKVSVISSANLTLPAPSPGKGIGWNAEGSGLENNNYPEQAAASAERAEDAAKQAENEVEKVSAVLSGLKTVPTFASIDLLRQAVKSDPPAAIVSAYHEGKPGGGGIFIADARDKSSADNGCTVIVSTDGTRWKRVFSGMLDLYDFGYVASENNALTTLNAAEAAALSIVVDCLGLSIDTGNTYPQKNKYTNGKFVINGKTVDAQYQQPRTGIGRFLSGSGVAAKLKSNEWTGTGIVAIGEGAMSQTEKCVSGIAIGDRAQGFSKISRDNIAIGADSLFSVQAETEWYDQSKMAGTRNIGIGGNAGRGITSGYANVSIGRNAGQGLGTGYSNVTLGSAALAGVAPIGLTGDIEVFWPSPTSRTVAIGESVLQMYQGRDAQTAIGGGAARNAKLAEKVTVVGAAAMENLERNRAPNGGDVLWTGTESGSYIQSGNTITLTFSNLHGATATYWVGIRLTSGDAQTLQNDVVPVQVVSVSGNTLTVRSPKELTTSGSAELKFVFSATSDSAKNEELTVIGANAMNKALTAGYSTIIGADAALLGGNYQKTTAIGASSLRTGSHISTTAVGYWTLTGANSEKCVVIGDSAGYRNVQGDILKGKITNSIAIGYGARLNGDNEIQIGSTGQTLYAPTAVNIRSDARDKTDIKPLLDGLQFVMKLKPVTGYYDRRDAYVDELFKDLPEEERAAIVREWWKNPTKDGRHKEDRLQHWFIAQDIAALESEYGQLPMVNLKNDTYTLEYESFVPVMVKAIQELSVQVEDLKSQLKELKK
ncbi:tail fiber domain-containing protein [Neisseria elongata]|uniref:tail fiber domain-containing protein n=1 Tax=Neisseria elongata TaxID=495 RepID=UPI001EF58461|nr:tail fiber domain-containing protein [Neisseria elongata]